MNTYHIEYFGLLKERRGLARETVHGSARTPAELYQVLLMNHHLGFSQNDLRAAVNDEIVSWEHPLEMNDNIALMPPMSGG